MNQTSHLRPDGTTFPPVTPDPPTPPGYTAPPEIEFAPDEGDGDVSAPEPEPTGEDEAGGPPQNPEAPD